MTLKLFKTNVFCMTQKPFKTSVFCIAQKPFKTSVFCMTQKSLKTTVFWKMLKICQNVSFEKHCAQNVKMCFMGIFHVFGEKMSKCFKTCQNVQQKKEKCGKM